jgi:hypothetical protein
VPDDEEEKLPTFKELPTSSDEESEDILSYAHRKLKASSAERLAVSKESYRKARKWDLEGRNLERRRVEALEALAEREREGSQADPDMKLPYSKNDLEEFLEHRKGTLSPKSIYWVEQSSGMLWQSTQGEISHRTVKALRDSVLEKYKSADSHSKVLSFAKGFLVWLAQTKIDQKYTSFSIRLEMPRAVKERKRSTDRIVTKEEIQNVLGYIKQAEHNGKISKQRAEQYTAFVIFSAFTGQRTESTMAKITVGQVRDALKMFKPVLQVEAFQDKIRYAHFVPLHPQVLTAIQPLLEGRKDEELLFKYQSFLMWVKRQKIPMSQFEGTYRLSDGRKYFEQTSDLVQLNETYRAFIMSHGVGGIAWTHYKAFQEDVVYDVFMSSGWRDIDLTG